MSDIISFSSNVTIHIDDCISKVANLVAQGITVDAIVTDPPYEINYMAKTWDNTNVSFQSQTWIELTKILKPGGFLVSFASARLYHHMALAIEQSGIETYPSMIWEYQTGMPKPQNVSKLFDRDNCPDRTPISKQKAAGYNRLQITHGQQSYSKLEFDVYEENISAEAKKWSGYYYGVNTLKPAFEMIYLGRKPISEPRVIDNIRRHGVGALNVERLMERGDGSWPKNVFRHKKMRSKDHGTSHPTVKPTALMEDLISLVCPIGGTVLDPFAGSGSTGLACLNLGHNCILIDNNPEMKSVIQKRLLLS